MDADPPTSADQTMQGVFSTIGRDAGARVVAYEMGNLPVEPAWSTASALANLVEVLRKYGADGGSFWRWTNFSNSEDTDPLQAEPIKRRGVAFVFNPVKTTLVQAYTSLEVRRADLNGDGRADILWRNADSGDVALFLMDGLILMSSRLIGNINPAWSVVGIGDFDGDGKADILWRNTGTGDNAIFLMNGFSLKASALIPAVSNLAWVVAGVADYDGDGKADILWRNTGTGDNAIFLMDAFNLTRSELIPSVSTSWTIINK